MKNLMNHKLLLISLLMPIKLCHSMTHFPPEDVFNFIPSRESCGAAVNEQKIQTYQSINSAFVCMKMGYKKIYLGSEDELNQLSDESKQLLRKKVIKKIVLPGRLLNPDKNIIFYIDAGEIEAYLFAKLLKKHNRKIKRLEKKLQSIAMIVFSNSTKNIKDNDLDILKEFIDNIKLYASEIQEIERQIEILEKNKNHYLYGILLGYAKKDIKYFYIKNNYTGTFKSDKQKAKQRIKKTKESINP